MSLSGVAWQNSARPSPSISSVTVSSNDARKSRCRGSSCAVSHAGGSPAAISRSAFPRTKRAPSSAISASQVSRGSAPAATSPQQTIASTPISSISASTASSAGRFPCTSEMAAIAFACQARCSFVALAFGDVTSYVDDPDDDRLGRLLVGGRRHDADLVDDLHPLGDLAEQRVVGRELGVLGRDDEELAAGGPGALLLRLGHRDDALGVRQAVRRRLDDRVAGAALAVAGRVAALDHEAGDDPVERQPVEEALVGQVLERAAGARGALGVERDLEVAAARRDRRHVGLGAVEALVRLRQLGVLLRRRRLHLLAAGGLGGRRSVRRRRGLRLLLVAARGEHEAGRERGQERERAQREPGHGRR